MSASDGLTEEECRERLDALSEAATKLVDLLCDPSVRRHLGHETHTAKRNVETALKRYG